MAGPILALENLPIEFVIVIPSYNNKNYYRENLDSACFQTSTHPYQVIYIDDCSPDNTGALVEEYVNKNKLESKVKIIHNEQRLGSGIANIYHAIHAYVEDHKIVVILDGDDTFPHNRVLSTLETYYANPDVWMTHSLQKYVPNQYIEGDPVPDWIYEETSVRELEWVSMTALRTFRAALFKKIDRQDLFYKGQFMTVSWDIAFCLPMIEMCASACSCGYSHYVFINEVLYHYHINNPINDFRTKKQLQIEVEKYIRLLPPYKPLPNLGTVKGT
jgi:glycosyltransferase involved in cell wall biosynthesis